MARSPVVDASNDVRRAFSDVFSELESIQRKLATLLNAPSVDHTTIDDLKRDIAKVRERPRHLDFRDVFRGSGPAHAIGYVPDPGPTASTTRYLREDGQWLEGNIEQAGFEDYGASSTISFVDGTRTFTIQPSVDSYNVWTAGQQYTKTGAESVVITDDEGLHTIYFDTDGVLTAASGPPTIEILEGKAFVAAIYWDDDNNTAIIFADERHGREMDGQTHAYLHFTFGTRYESGLGLGNMTVDGNGDSDSHAQFSVADGAIWDEDLRFAIADDDPQDLSTTAEIPLYYLSGAGAAWRKFAATSFPCRTADGTTGKRLGYNQLTGGAWQITEVSNLNFCLMHYFATDNIAEPIIGVFGQEQYQTLAQAREGATTELSALNFGQMEILINEFKAIATVIFQTSLGYANTVNARIRSTDTGADYIDWRNVAGGAASGTAVSSTMVGCSIYTGANQLIANNSATAVTFASEVFDTSAFHSTGSNTSRITIPTGLDGKYLFTFRATWASSATGYRGFGWYIGGALYRWAQNIGPAQSGTGAGAAGLSAAIVLNLTAGQYVEVFVIQTSGGNLNLVGASAGFAQSLECVFLGG